MLKIHTFSQSVSNYGLVTPVTPKVTPGYSNYGLVTPVTPKFNLFSQFYIFIFLLSFSKK
jgi:hypothetical protein